MGKRIKVMGGWGREGEAGRTRRKRKEFSPKDSIEKKIYRDKGIYARFWGDPPSSCRI